MADQKEKKTEEKEDKKEEIKTVYHYTSEENAAKIRESGEIRPSSDGAYGGGKNT